jgi:hypothetical protein
MITVSESEAFQDTELEVEALMDTSNDLCSLRGR